MTEKENFIKTLNFDNPEWIPLGAECVEFVMPTDVIRERPSISEGSGYDWFGIYWELINDKNLAVNGFSCSPGSEILEDITKWKEVVEFPVINSLDWNKAEETASHLDRENKLSMLFWESGPFERVVSLLGFEETLVSLYTEPEAFCELMDAITDFKISLIPGIKKYYNPDMVCVLEDVSYHKAPFMSNELYRKMIYPYDKRLSDAIIEHDMMYVYHSCGNITPLLSEIVNLNPKMILGGFAQSNDQKLMEKKYGDRVCFLGPIDSAIMADENTTDEDIINEVHRCIDTFKEHKNLIFDTTLTYPDRMELAVKEYYSYTGRNSND